VKRSIKRAEQSNRVPISPAEISKKNGDLKEFNPIPVQLRSVTARAYCHPGASNDQPTSESGIRIAGTLASNLEEPAFPFMVMLRAYENGILERLLIIVPNRWDQPRVLLLCRNRALSGPTGSCQLP
jgi:hypothetical protein